MRLNTLFAAALGLTLGWLSATAQAAATSYDFEATGPLTGNAAIVSLLGNATASGHFLYNPDAPLLAGSGALGFTPGYAIYTGTELSNLAFFGLQGQVAGLGFAAKVGSVAVGDNVVAPPTGTFDALAFNADTSPKVGANTTPPASEYPRDLIGFTLGDYTLSNVRLVWTANSTALGSFALPGQPPASGSSFSGRLALDFVLTSDPTNAAGTDYFTHTVFITGLKATPTPLTANVPEPDTLALVLLGLGGMVWVHRRQAS